MILSTIVCEESYESEGFSGRSMGLVALAAHHFSIMNANVSFAASVITGREGLDAWVTDIIILGVGPHVTRVWPMTS